MLNSYHWIPVRRTSKARHHRKRYVEELVEPPVLALEDAVLEEPLESPPPDDEAPSELLLGVLDDVSEDDEFAAFSRLRFLVP